MDKTAITIGISAELPQSNRLVRGDGNTGSAATATKAADAVVSRLDFFEVLVGTVIEISQLSVFP